MTYKTLDELGVWLNESNKERTAQKGKVTTAMEDGAGLREQYAEALTKDRKLPICLHMITVKEVDGYNSSQISIVYLDDKENVLVEEKVELGKYGHAIGIHCKGRVICRYFWHGVKERLDLKHDYTLKQWETLKKKYQRNDNERKKDIRTD